MKGAQYNNKDEENKKKFTFRKVLSTLLIIIGIALIVIPIVLREMNVKNQEKMLENFYLEAEVTDEEGLSIENNTLDDAFLWATVEENQNEIVAGSQDSVTSSGVELEEATSIKAMPTVIGAITIDKIDLIAPIGEGFGLDVLKFTIGHLPESAGLGEVGNTVLAGHRSYSYGVFFNRLDELEIGDEIKITAGDGTVYTYEVYEKYIVEPDDLSPMRGSSSNKVLTLITCHPPIIADSRLIIHAVEKTD
jgi:sortase A